MQTQEHTTREGDDLLAILFGPQPEPAPIPTPAPTFTTRYFYRCADCLTVAATLTRIPEVRRDWLLLPDAVCEACGGKIEFMGETVRNRTITLEVGFRAICDGKCISATGPNCDCKCGGAHHGSGMVVPIHQDGPIPRLAVPAKAREKGEAYRALVAQVEASWERKYRAAITAKYQGWVPSDVFALFCDSGRERASINAAKQMRSHAGRNKHLAEILARLNAKGRA